MANDYTTVFKVKKQLGIVDTSEDDLIQDAIEAASRWIDAICETTFYPVTEARIFESHGCAEYVMIDKIVDTTGLVVKTGPYGSYSTTVAATDYLLRPFNATKRHGGAYYEISAPYGRGSWWGQGYIEITATWGWPEPPEDVAEAALIMAAQIYRRSDSPEAVIGALDETTARLYSQFDDPTVSRLLKDYREIGAGY